MTYTGKWIPNLLQQGGNFEISVLREDNQHGRNSYGWFGEDKMAISTVNSQFKTTSNAVLILKLSKIAQEMADLFNSGFLNSHQIPGK